MFGVWDSALRVLEVRGSGFRVQGSGFRVQVPRVNFPPRSPRLRHLGETCSLPYWLLHVASIQTRHARHPPSRRRHCRHPLCLLPPMRRQRRQRRQRRGWRWWRWRRQPRRCFYSPSPSPAFPPDCHHRPAPRSPRPTPVLAVVSTAWRVVEWTTASRRSTTYRFRV